MKNHGIVRSTVEPKVLVIDENSVWVAEEVKPVKEESTGAEDQGFEGFEYKLSQYSKDEYILQLDERDKMKSDAILELSEIVSGIMEGA